MCMALLLLQCTGGLRAQTAARQRAWADSVYERMLTHDDVPVKDGLLFADSMSRIYARASERCREQEARVFLANCLDRSGRPDSALHVLLACKDALGSNCGDRSWVYWYNNLSAVYLSLGRFEDTDSLTTGALQRLGQKEPAVRELGLNRGIAQASVGHMEEAMASFSDVYAYGLEAPRPDLMESALLNIGTLHAMQGQLRYADTSYQAVLRSVRSSHNTRNAIEALQNLAGIASDNGHGARALHLLDSLIAIAGATEDLEVVSNATRNLAEVTLAHGNKDSAFYILRRHIALRDSVLGKERVRAVADMEVRYETEKKAKENLALRATNLEVELDRARVKRIRNVLGLCLAFAITFGSVVFYQRNRIARERKRSEELLLNILPEEVAAELKAKGEAEAVLIDQVTVLFTDFKGFTAMSEQVTPKDLVRDLNDCFSAFDRITEKYGIEKIKTIGDAYMAAGGLPVPNNTHAIDVINAALEMRDFIAAGKARKAAAGLPYFEIRIGVHTGPVVAGIVGVKKFQYDIWGDTVNTASRMESSGEVGQVNISEATYALVKNEASFTFIPRGKVQAKGKGELEMYFVAEQQAT